MLVIDNGGLQHTDTVSIDVEDNGIADFSDDVLPTTSKMGKVVGIKVEDGGAVTSFIMTLPSSVPDTSDAPTDMIYGLIDMELKPDTAGGTIRITIHLEDPAPAEYLWYKYGPDKGWYDYSSYAEFNTDRDQVTLTLVDGGMGDDDGVANGVIIDPSGLGSNPDVADTSTTTTVEPTTSGSSGGGGGGCFISTVGN